MHTWIRDENDFLSADDEQRIKLIFDLTRRIHLLEDLMSAARAKRRIATDEVSMAPAPLAINGNNVQ